MALNRILVNRNSALLITLIGFSVYGLLGCEEKTPESKARMIEIARNTFRPSEGFLRMGSLHNVTWTFIGACPMSGDVQRDERSGQVALGVDVVDENLKKTRRYFDDCVDPTDSTIVPLNAEASAALDH